MYGVVQIYDMAFPQPLHVADGTCEILLPAATFSGFLQLDPNFHRVVLNCAHEPY